MKLKLIVIFLISFVTISSQNMLSYEMGLPEIELSLEKPQNKFVARNRTGAAYYLSTDDLAKFNYTDINRALNKISLMYKELVSGHFPFANS